MGQYSKLLTKNTPPPNIRNINIIIIPRMKGGIITLNKNEFLVYNFFLPGQSCYIFNVQLFMSVCSSFSSCEFCDDAFLSYCCVIFNLFISWFCQINLFLALSENNYFKKFKHLKIGE